MNYLSRIEEIVLIATWKLKDEAFGVSIIEQVEKDTGSSWLTGAIYGVLNRLRKKGYIETTKVEQSPEQMGHPRIYYRVSRSGMDKLIAAQKINQSVWDGVPDLDKGE